MYKHFFQVKLAFLHIGIQILEDFLMNRTLFQTFKRLLGVLKTTSPLLKTYVTFHLLLGLPPPSLSEKTSFMDGPL
jgi:hypothetical protein